MVDETEFRSAWSAMNELPCPFKKAIFSTVCACQKSERIFIGDREAIGCREFEAFQRCHQLLDQLQQAARFTLKVSNLPGGLPHRKQMKVETGGLIGLQIAMNDTPPENTAPENTAPRNTQPGVAIVADAWALLEAATAQWGKPEDFPYAKIVRAIQQYTPPGSKRSKRKRSKTKPTPAK